MNTTVTQELTAVNVLIPTVVTWYTYYATPKPDDSASDGPDLAAKWGREDALEGNDAQGSVYFPLESPAWHSYNSGYAAGLAVRKALAPPSELDEIEFMAQALDSLRSGPQVAMGYVQEAIIEIDELAAEEWIGNAFSTAPYNW